MKLFIIDEDICFRPKVDKFILRPDGINNIKKNLSDNEVVIMGKCNILNQIMFNIKNKTNTNIN